MDRYLKGTCEKMCPPAEILMRSRERLLHFFELDQQRNNSSSDIIVKAFSRSAAGQKLSKNSDLRTQASLIRTIEYLLTVILKDKRKPFYFVYDFIFDRTRSVRQEIVIQNLNLSLTIQLLEPIVMFLAYSSYRLCEEEISNYDPKICEQHLQECLKKLLCCYDDEANKTEQLYKFENRCFIESLYLVMNLASFEALTRGITLPKDIRNNELVKLCLQVSLSFWTRNYYKCLSLIDELPHIICAVVSLKISTIRLKLLSTFSAAFHNNNKLTVSSTWLQKCLLYDTIEDLSIDCKHYCIEMNSSEVHFNKNTFDSTKGTNCIKHLEFVDIKLKDIFLPDVLLLRRF